MEGPKRMSVNTSDEYLDALLQAIEPIIYPEGPEIQEPEPITEPFAAVPVVETAPMEAEPTAVAASMEAEPVVNTEQDIEQAVTVMPMEEAVVEVTEDTIMSFDAEDERTESADIDVSSLLGALSQEEASENNEEVLESVEPEIDLSAFLTEDMDLEEEGMASTNQASEDDNSAAIGDLLAALTAESDELEELDTDTEDIDSLLSAVSEPSVMDSSVPYNQDVKELLNQFSEDEDLSDIQDMLDKNDNGEALDNSLLDIPQVEVFKVEEDGEDNAAAIKSGNIVEKMVNSLHRFFKRKKAEKEEAQQTDGNPETEEVQEAQAEENIQEEGLADVNEISLIGDMPEDDVDELVLDDDMSDIEMLLSGGNLQNTDSSEETSKDEAAGAEESVSGKGKKKSRKEKKEKKEKDKKETIFTKILNMLTEEIDEPTAKKGSVPEAGETGITDENLGILKELSKEDKKKAKKEEKKNKKNAKKGGKKGDAEEADSKDGKGKKAKPKKEKKKREKKEKKEKPVVISKPEKKLSRKRVRAVFGLCFSILAAILILQNVVSKSDNIKEAQYAFDTADYETCFANLSGLERTEEEEALYQKSFIILSVQRKLDSYNNFMLMKREVEALNSLFEGVTAYREQEANAVEWGVQGQIMAIYEEIWDKLESYGLSSADIEEILAYESKVTYTKRLDSIVNGTPFDINDTMDGEVIEEAQPLEDVLPGEEDFLPEDTTDVTVGQIPEGENSAIDENDVEPYEEQHGQTVVVGSAPVDISGDTQEDFGGQNVGSGSTDVSVELNGNSVVVGGF